MTLWEHLEELRLRLKRVLLVLLVLFVVFMAFGLRTVVVGDVAVPVPYPEGFELDRTAAGQVLVFMVDYVVPPEVNVTVLTPWEAIIVHLKVAFFLAIVAGMPFIGYEIGRFIGPGLYASERRMILRLAIPAALLFLSGALVAFFLILPFIFQFLYGVAGLLGVDLLLLSLDQFVDFTLLFMAGFGLAFQLPIAMYVLSAIGLVGPTFWKRNWRYAAIAIFLFGAIITPDTSGVTMFIVSLPILLLYVIGYVVARMRWTKDI
jgi:sec-independent protein translocase protein TatC